MSSDGLERYGWGGRDPLCETGPRFCLLLKYCSVRCPENITNIAVWARAMFWDHHQCCCLGTSHVLGPSPTLLFGHESCSGTITNVTVWARAMFWDHHQCYCLGTSHVLGPSPMLLFGHEPCSGTITNVAVWARVMFWDHHQC